MIPIRQFDALLQTQSLNNKLFQTLVLGVLLPYLPDMQAIATP